MDATRLCTGPTSCQLATAEYQLSIDKSKPAGFDLRAPTAQDSSSRGGDLFIGKSLCRPRLIQAFEVLGGPSYWLSCWRVAIRHGGAFKLCNEVQEEEADIS